MRKDDIFVSVCIHRVVQASIYRATLVQMRLGMFDDSTPWDNLGPDDVCTTAALNLALSASRQGVVLLKNNQNTLPLDNSTVSSIANIGPNANNDVVIEGNYHGTPPFLINVQAGLSMYVSQVTYEEGVQMDSNNVSGIAAAVTAAKQADATVMVMGLDESQEREGHDRLTYIKWFISMNM